ncbi:hypothetical protein SAMN06265360_1343 [Haloechinothrix alba]|uniref:Membrane transport protein MMPL domain-containing protein n=1 Tax=Haloechinothrix alba TaxID=664784 RepID=A0A239AA49_9PSEU|nr:RND transporter [Haloechinothrix alba]SNR92282.1 hypothetical protein SAMN06265360_1343 [Haloechinothrix alba]
MLFIVGLAAVGGAVQLRTDTGPGSFLPAGDETLRQLEDAAGSFGGDPVVVLVESEEPRELLAPGQLPRLAQLEGELANLDDASVVYGPGTVLNQIAGSAQNMLAALSGHRDGLRERALEQAREEGASEEEAEAEADAAVAEFDRRYGSLLVQGLPAGLPTLHNPAFVDQVIFGGEDAPQPRWNFVVPRGDAVSILVRPREGLDQAGIEGLVDEVGSRVQGAELAAERVTVTGVPAVTAGLGERVRQEIPLLGGLAVGLIGASYLLVPWIRRRRRRLLPLAATLGATTVVLAGFGWLDRPLSLGVIAFLPILVGIGSDFPAYLSQPGTRRPAIVAALASATAFASLAVVPLPFVRDLGLALAAGQLVALGLALVAQRWWLAARGGGGAGSGDDLGGEVAPEQGGVGVETTGGGSSAAGVMGMARRRWVSRVGVAVLVGSVAVAGWSGLAQLEVEAQPDRLAEGLPAIEDARHAERVLGASGEVQVLVRGQDVATPEALGWMRQAQDELVTQHGDRLRPILTPPSLLAFLGPEPTEEQLAAGLQWMPEYLTQAVIRSDQRRASMSFQLGLQDLAEQKQLIDQVRADLPPLPEGLEADVVGLPVAAARGYELVSGDRYLANGVGVLGAGAVLLLGLARRMDAVRAVLAAGLATGWGIAALWVLNVALTPLTMAVGSLTTAIACAYTVMLRQSAGTGSWRLRRTVAVAALSAALGYLALTASGVAVLREFGLVLAGAVALSFAAAHLVVWLTGPRASSPDSAPQADSPRVTTEATV